MQGIVSPNDVFVSRTVNRDKTTILVTVPHSTEALLSKTKIGKVEISLESPIPERSKDEAVTSREVVMTSRERVMTSR